MTGLRGNEPDLDAIRWWSGEPSPEFRALAEAEMDARADPPNENADRCPVCGGLGFGDVTHARC